MVKSLKRMMVSIFILILPFPVFSRDVNWRGTDEYGIASDPTFNPDTLKGNPKILWQAELGRGYSNVVLSGDYLYTTGSEWNVNKVYCLNRKSGKVVWTIQYKCASGNYPGPKATPVLDGDNLYIFSQEGQLHCLDSKTGKIKWMKDFKKLANLKPPSWGQAGTPVILGNMILLNAGDGGIALNKTNGAFLWKTSGTSGYATVVPFKSRDSQMAAIFGYDTLYSVDVKTGKKGWSVNWKNSSNVNAADPLIIDNRIFISSDYNRGCALFEITDNSIKKIWENKTISSHVGSFIYKDGFIYGINGSPSGSGSSINCIDVKNGKSQWKAVKGFGSLVGVNNYIVFLGEKGDLLVARLFADKYVEVAGTKLPKKGLFWTAPYVMDGRLYARSDRGNLYCIDVK
ncbi:MAG: PQQ-like beta-propeller repeat protein [Spirochaetales bacterium]|nr:PQQ-like beta-propeller repeat protein [Spirochaetales bacterium]